AVLIASFVVVSVSNLVRDWLGGDFVLIDLAADILTTLTSGAILAAVIALLFHFLTRQSIGWRVSAFGGLTTAFVLTIGNRLFVEYMQRFGSSSLVGATGSILVGIVWLYAIAQIILAGAELTRTLGRRLPGAVR
ncbi:YhjD/YihY/BrkB family envelope integrity protein, partial [Ilumatobacter sp.]|uniref:YhjD/YihY/BrkB family envelope integrity protein n=1 Tax=Ilumatobacter sp. TaxID=1967498 RepID=UPI003C4F81EF